MCVWQINPMGWDRSRWLGSNGCGMEEDTAGDCREGSLISATVTCRHESWKDETHGMSNVQGSDWGSIVTVLGMTLNSSVMSWAWRFHPLLSRAWWLNCCHACKVALSGMLMRVYQGESSLHEKGVDSLNWYGSHFWVCITFCK